MKYMKTEVCVYEGTEVSFEMDRDHGLMVNATEMAKIFGKDVPDFTILKQTKDFISECLKNQNSGFLGVKSEADLIISRQKSGTWMHRVLALKFAAWLSPSFELWVYRTIEGLLFGKLTKREASFRRTMLLQQERDHLYNKPEKTGADFVHYLEVERKLKRETVIRRLLTVEDLSGMRSLFEEDEINELVEEKPRILGFKKENY
jgi:hypothetical protein